MNLKKKIVSATAVLSLGAVAIVGTSLAYFTDKDSKTNQFTTGNVDIELKEEFFQGSKLLPTTGRDEEGNLKNAVKKEVTVKNTGSEDAFVRVHIAIPAVLDEPTNASRNLLHFNYPKESADAGKWDWTKDAGAPYDGENWNMYSDKIDGVDYNVYVVTYGTALAKDQETPEKAMHQVYLDKDATNEMVAAASEAIGSDEWKILVAAEGTQAAGFDDAYEALNTSFGIPGMYDAFKK